MTIIHIFNILPLGNLETSLASTPRKKSQLWKRTTWGTIVKGNVSRARLFWAQRTWGTWGTIFKENVSKARLFWPQSRTAPSASARGLCVILWSISNLKLQISALLLKCLPLSPKVLLYIFKSAPFVEYSSSSNWDSNVCILFYVFFAWCFSQKLHLERTKQSQASLLYFPLELLKFRLF